MPSLIQDVLANAIGQIKERGLPVFTFALYHDHESAAISVCVDTEANSAKSVVAANHYSITHFQRAIRDGDLKSADLWQANIGSAADLRLLKCER